jgi:hypothetical protein
MPADWLSKTDWIDFEDPIIGTLIPNFFITYFEQVLPHGGIKTMRSWQHSFVWALDTNYGLTLPKML